MNPLLEFADFRLTPRQLKQLKHIFSETCTETVDIDRFQLRLEGAIRLYLAFREDGDQKSAGSIRAKLEGVLKAVHRLRDETERLDTKSLGIVAMHYRREDILGDVASIAEAVDQASVFAKSELRGAGPRPRPERHLFACNVRNALRECGVKTLTYHEDGLFEHVLRFGFSLVNESFKDLHSRSYAALNEPIFVDQPDGPTWRLIFQPKNL